MNTADPVKRSSLSDKTIVVTRRKEQAREFADLLMREGAGIILYPAVEISEPLHWDACDEVLNGITRYEGIIFTSVNAVHSFFRRAKSLKLFDAVVRIPSFAVGEITRKAITSYGAEPALIPASFSAEELAREIVRLPTANRRFLFPKGNLAGEVIPSILRSQGAIVDEVTVYMTAEPPFDDKRQLLMKEIEDRATMITFFSPSSVDNFARRISPAILRTKDIGAIGQTTADAARRLGLTVAVTAPNSTAGELVHAIKEYYASTP